MKKHLVIIEDDLTIMEILKESLSDNYRITAMTQVDHIDDLIAMKPDAYLIDEVLPVVNGHLLCIILKSKPQTRDIPVILMSGHPKLEYYASLCNADHHFMKPFDITKLVNTVAGAVSTVRTDVN